MWGDAADHVALAVARVLPVAVCSPLVGGRAVPLAIRIAVGVLLAMAVAAVSPTTTAGGPFVLLLAKEFLVGITLAMGVLLFFEALAGAGALVDAAAGRMSSGVHATIDSPHESPMGTFARLFGLAFFFSLGGGRMVVRTLADAGAVLSVGAVDPTGIIAAGAAYFQTVLLLAAPVWIALLLADLTFAAAARALPPINGFFLGLSFKPLLAVLLCGLVLLGAIESRLADLGPTLRGLASGGGSP